MREGYGAYLRRRASLETRLHFFEFGRPRANQKKRPKNRVGRQNRQTGRLTIFHDLVEGRRIPKSTEEKKRIPKNSEDGAKNRG